VLPPLGGSFLSSDHFVNTVKLSMWGGLVLLTSIACYWNGLNGPFLFDDFANLPALAEFGGVNDWKSFQLFFLNGIAGPTGRPLSLISFLIDDNAWPSDPRGFKYTNLMLHLLNGVLLVWLIFLIGRLHGRDDRTATAIAFLVGTFWLLHPLNVSTVLYVVQRMAILSAMFVIVGLVLFVQGRTVLADHPVRGFILIGTALGLFTTFAALSKENGIILPALSLVFEYTLFANVKPPKRCVRNVMSALVWLPSAALMAYLIHVGLKEGAYSGRTFTVGQRLLTEPRVLCDYMLHWVVPFFSPRGLFVENYPISTGWFMPHTTFPAILGLFCLGVVAIIWRHRAPLVSLAIGFYLVGHLIESTTIPLEIYFEHRNYLPTMLLLLPVADYGIVWLRNGRLLVALSAVLLLGMAYTTYRLAAIWGDEEHLMLKWAVENPTSGRAQEALATVLDREGQADAAHAILTSAFERQPTDVHLSLHFLVHACHMDKLSADVFNGLLDRLRSVRYSLRDYPLLEGMVEQLPNGRCQNLGFPQLHALLDTFGKGLDEREVAVTRQLLHLHGVVYARQHQGDDALASFRKGQQILPNLSGGLLEVSILASNRYYEHALMLLSELEHMPEAKKDNTMRRYATLEYPVEIAGLRRTIEDDLHQSRINN
jgi:protein O-mannosyl-transferase